MIQIKKNEKVGEYISILETITNKIKHCGGAMNEQTIAEKVQRSQTPQFDFIMVAIEESHDMRTIKMDEL